MKKQRTTREENSGRKFDDTITLSQETLEDVLGYFARFNNEPVVQLTGNGPKPLNEAARKMLRGTKT